MSSASSTPTSPRTAASPTPFPARPATRPPPSPGAPAAPSPVSPASPAAGPTAPAREPSATCAAAAGCSPPPRSGAAGTAAVNVNQRRFAVVSALAASSVPSLVLARGHKIESVPELPLVVSDSIESVEKTSAAIKILNQIGALPDANKAKDSTAIRPGKGKMRNRRYISRKGPLIVYGTEGAKIVKAFRNIPGVDVANVERLNLLKLAPGGHLGRFVVWTKSAFEKLDKVFGTFEKGSEVKKGYVLPRAKMGNADLGRIINSDEVQSVVRPITKDVKRRTLKKNPLNNLNAMLKLNPYAKTARRMSLLAEAQRVKAKAEKLDKKRSKVSKEEAAAIKAAGKSWYKTMVTDSDYAEFENFTKWLGVTQ
ncbi:uncharacterized protein M6B38_313780 [Iris pallida]|uniref:Large ribosomal subunit protein uL4 C-terminal domain-containing protein n=1 Tax=Iris pallida TaxID=29817 RepID=A0AAX6HFA9_IRIPA|nr:uncharacterized protein M6B38_313780 [Iris pallida]